MSLSLLSTIVLSTAVMNVEVDALPYLDPPSPWWPSYSYPLKGGDSILREQGEKLLLKDASSEPRKIPSVIVLVNVDYERMRDAVRGLVKARWGIVDEHEDARGHIKMTPATREILHLEIWPTLGEGLVGLSGQASTAPAREYQLTSQPYNKIESLDGFSQVVIRVSDGAALFHQAVSILQLTRTDCAREWARSGELHGLIPLPYKEKRCNVGVVTNTEIAFIEDLKKDIPGFGVRYFLAEEWDGGSIREKMQEAIEQLKKP